jgi:hypothetical protein
MIDGRNNFEMGILGSKSDQASTHTASGTMNGECGF